MRDISFASWVLKRDPSMPIVLQSNDSENKLVAKSLGVGFLNKSSNTFFKDLRLYIAKNFWFWGLHLHLSKR